MSYLLTFRDHLFTTLDADTGIGIGGIAIGDAGRAITGVGQAGIAPLGWGANNNAVGTAPYPVHVAALQVGHGGFVQNQFFVEFFCFHNTLLYFLLFFTSRSNGINSIMMESYHKRLKISNGRGILRMGHRYEEEIHQGKGKGKRGWTRMR